MRKTRRNKRARPKFRPKSEELTDWSVEPVDPQPVRAEILRESISLTAGSRNKSYGEPADNLRAQALLIDAYLSEVRLKRVERDGGNFRLTSHDVAVISALIKIGRIATGTVVRDNYVDAAAYMAIAGELA